MPSSFTFEGLRARLYRVPELLYSSARVPYSKTRVTLEEARVPYSLSVARLILQ